MALEINIDRLVKVIRLFTSEAERTLSDVDDKVQRHEMSDILNHLNTMCVALDAVIKQASSLQQDKVSFDSILDLSAILDVKTSHLVSDLEVMRQLLVYTIDEIRKEDTKASLSLLATVIKILFKGSKDTDGDEAMTRLAKVLAKHVPHYLKYVSESNAQLQFDNLNAAHDKVDQHQDQRKTESGLFSARSIIDRLNR